MNTTDLMNNPLTKEKLIVVKIGGNIIDDKAKLSLFLNQFSEIEGKKILVHGGGKLATQLSAKLQIPQQMIEGRRITDAETLDVVTMVYAGLINKTIVATLQSNQCNAIGLTGADGNAIAAHKRKMGNGLTSESSIDFGFVGDIDAINTVLVESLLNQAFTLVFAPICHDRKGQLLNTNADTIAQEIAKAMSDFYDVQLIYSFEKTGVLMDATDEESVISPLDFKTYQQLKEKNIIHSGMIPKLDNAFAALDSGVSSVVIGKAEHLQDLVAGTSGTTILLQKQ